MSVSLSMALLSLQMPVMFMEGDEPVCGVCGDALFGPQDNLIGGRYVSFPTRVTRYYDASLSNIIPVTFFLNQTVIPVTYLVLSSRSLCDVGAGSAA